MNAIKWSSYRTNGKNIRLSFNIDCPTIAVKLNLINYFRMSGSVALFFNIDDHP